MIYIEKFGESLPEESLTRKSVGGVKLRKAGFGRSCSGGSCEGALHA
jgi:hypothetical protein